MDFRPTDSKPQPSESFNVKRLTIVFGEEEEMSIQRQVLFDLLKTAEKMIENLGAVYIVKDLKESTECEVNYAIAGEVNLFVFNVCKEAALCHL
jgi:hypothetical protein